MIKVLSIAGKIQGEISRQIGCSQSTVSACKANHLDTRNMAVNMLSPSGTTRSWQNWYTHTDFRIAGKLTSSGILMICLYHNQ